MRRLTVLVAVIALGGVQQGEASVNVALGKPAIANESYEGQGPENVVDGDLATQWSGPSWGTPENPYWVRIDLEGLYRPDRIVLYGVETGGQFPGYFVNYVLDYSTDSTTWHLIQTGTLYDDPIDCIDDIALPGTEEMRYIRYTVDGGTHWANLRELEVYAAPIPEPAALVVWSLLGASGIGIGWWRRRRGA